MRLANAQRSAAGKERSSQNSPIISGNSDLPGYKRSWLRAARSCSAPDRAVVENLSAISGRWSPVLWMADLDVSKV